MNMLSTTDGIFLGTIACGATAYFSRSYLQQWQMKAIEPLIPPQNAQTAPKAQAVSLPRTRNVSKVLSQLGRQCAVFYGSQTGTAERLAQQFSKEAKARFGLECVVADLDDYDYDDLLSLPDNLAVVFLLATYGEGEATDNAVAFDQYLRKLQDRISSSESTLTYAAFGLGNSSYQFYNQMIKRLDNVLTQRGARRVGKTGFGDDGKGTLEEDYMIWKTSTLPQLASHFGCVERPYKYDPSFRVVTRNPHPTNDTLLGEPNKRYLRDKSRGPYTLANPFAAPLVAARDLSSGGSRQLLHLDLDLSQSTLTYEAGDHLAIRSVNSNLEVERFLRVFGLLQTRNEEIDVLSLDPALKVSIPTPTTYDSIARYYLDICAPVTRQMLATAAVFAPNEVAASKLAHLSTEMMPYQMQVTDLRRNIAQVLESCEPAMNWNAFPFSALLENIPVMKPRYYSISSSPLASKRIVSITTVVESERFGESCEEFKGVATNYLAALSASLRSRSAIPFTATHEIAGPRQRFSHPTALVSVRRSKFKLPRDESIPVIMIGPGTGVAPFRGFIQSRCQQHKEGKTVGRTILFYGCRRSDEDFLYQQEWQDISNKMTTDTFSMHVAFSREPGKVKRYVQHLFSDHAEELRRLILKKNSHVYVCGDAHKMARDVFRAMAEVIAKDTQFKGDCERSQNYLLGLKRDGRWLEDVW